MKALQTSYLRVGEKEPEMNFSRYLRLRSAWLFPKARWDITVNTCRLHSPCYALLWELVSPKNNDFLGSIAHSQVKLPFLGNWKDNSAKLPNLGFSRQRDRITDHSHNYIFIKTIACDSIIGHLDFLKTLFSELTLGNAFLRFDKSRTLTKADLSQTCL